MQIKKWVAGLIFAVSTSGCTFLPDYLDSPIVQADLSDCKTLAAQAYNPSSYLLGGTALGFVVGGVLEALDEPRCEGRHSGSRYYDRPCPAGYDRDLFISSDGSDGTMTSWITGLGTVAGFAALSAGRNELITQCMDARGHYPR